MVFKRTFWIGYSSLQLSLGWCFQKQYFPSENKYVLIRKTKRYNSTHLADRRVYLYSPILAPLLFFYIILTRSTLWIPGISPTSCSAIEKIALRLLFKLRQLRFADDGLAGFVPHTYTWHHTIKSIPMAHGNITWDQQVRSTLFENSLTVSTHLLKLIKSGINEKLLVDHEHYSIFIEANAMNIDLLYSSFVQCTPPNAHKFYFAHTDKGSVSRQFTNRTHSSLSNKKINSFSSHQYNMLESYLMHMLDKSLSLSIFSGCTSTVLILLSYASKSNQLNKVRFYYSPDYSTLHADKVEQTKAFYQYITNYFNTLSIRLS